MSSREIQNFGTNKSEIPIEILSDLGSANIQSEAIIESDDSCHGQVVQTGSDQPKIRFGQFRPKIVDSAIVSVLTVSVSL